MRERAAAGRKYRQSKRENQWRQSDTNAEIKIKPILRLLDNI